MYDFSLSWITDGLQLNSTDSIWEWMPVYFWILLKEYCVLKIKMKTRLLLFDLNIYKKSSKSWDQMDEIWQNVYDFFFFTASLQKKL